MAIESKRIRVSELDFDQIKSNLKDFLRGQSQFTDYDFEGSGLSILLDVLAYNTHYNSLYTNMAINEMFLDSATKRNSVVSISKMLGYTPYSARCAEAVVQVTVSNTSSTPTTLTLPKATPFITTVDGVNYTFYTTEAVSAPFLNSSYAFDDVRIIEGTPLSFKFNVAPGARYIVPNQFVDTNTLVVRVQESATSSVFIAFSKSTDITEIDSNSNVYFLKEIDDGYYELEFGDGVLGQALQNGNVVHVDYFVTNREAPNGAKIFRYNGVTFLGGVISTATVTTAFGGAEQESVESIRFNAPKFYQAADRAVTPTDYKALVANIVPQAQSVSVWGGEDNNPPVYGKVFICIKPTTGEVLTTSTKQVIANDIIKKKSVVSIIPEIVDPVYLKIVVNATVYYNPLDTTRTEEALRTLVRDTILNYNETELNRFDGMFRYSKLSRQIDATEPSILSNITRVKLKREFTPVLNTNATYILDISNPIYTEDVPEDQVLSSAFYIGSDLTPHYFVDDGLGNIKLFYLSGTNERIFVNDNQGTVDYVNGVITINDLNVSSAPNNLITVSIIPQSNDIVSVRNQLAVISEEDIVVNAIVDKVASGQTSGGTGYTFTSSR